MSEARVERRLAAILAADVAGYSRLMGADEEGTLAVLRAAPGRVHRTTSALKSIGIPYRGTKGSGR
jgi:class 3 adenylate cyclase